MAPPEATATHVIRFAESAIIGRPPVITAVAITPDSKHLVTAGDDHTIRLFALATGQFQTELKGHTDWVRSIAISPDGSTLYSAGDDRTIRRWHLPDGQPISELDRLGHTIDVIALSHDGKHLAAAGFADELRIYDTTTFAL